MDEIEQAARNMAQINGVDWEQISEQARTNYRTFVQRHNLQGIDAQGFIERRYLDDGRMLAVDPLMFGRARLGIGQPPKTGDPRSLLEADGFDDHWEYETISAALDALRAWDMQHGEEPEGWSRHPKSGRYKRGVEEQKIQFGAFTFSRPAGDRVTIDVDEKAIILRPRELSASEAIALARFLVRDDTLLASVDEQTAKNIHRAIIENKESGE